MKLGAVFFLTLLSGMLNAACGQSSGDSVELLPRSTWVSVEIAGGCILMTTIGSPAPPDATLNWSGECKAGEAIDGSGVLRTEFGQRSSATFEGTFVSGVAHGTGLVTQFLSGEEINRFSEEYNMGCGSSDLYCVPYVPPTNE
jgi:hypothetical protein